MDLDAYVIQLNRWREDINTRLSALEQRSINGGGSAVSPEEIALLTERLTAAEAKVNETTGVLSSVETALASHGETLKALSTPASEPPPQPPPG